MLREEMHKINRSLFRKVYENMESKHVSREGFIHAEIVNHPLTLVCSQVALSTDYICRSLT